MARNYGRFTTTIWRDRDFTKLTRAQQAVYFMLCTQPEVTAAGTLPLTLRRWASTAVDETPATLRDQLKALEDAGHIVIDEDTEELLIVKFVKFDQGWYNEKRWPLVAAALSAIASVHIRDTAVDEVVRLSLSACPSHDLSQGQWDKAIQRVRQWIADKAPDRASGSDRSGLTVGGYEGPTPQTATLTPGTSLLEGEPSPPLADDPLSDFCLAHQPNGAPGACRDCATRRTANAERKRARLDAEVAIRKAAREAIENCGDCDEKGVRLHPRSKLPLGRCDHQPAEAAVS